MPRKWSRAVPEGNDPVPHDEVGPDQLTMADLYRMTEELFDQSHRKLDELTEEMRGARPRLADLEQDTRQPRLAIEVNGPTDTKTRKRTENAAADQELKHEDSCSANQADPDPMCLTSFGRDSAGLLAFPCLRDDALVKKGAAAPKPCISPVEMRTQTTTGGLLLTGTASTATRTIFDQPPLWFCLTEEICSRTSIQYATYYSSLWKMKVLETKSRQTLVLDPCGSTGRLRACSFLGR